VPFDAVVDNREFSWSRIRPSRLSTLAAHVGDCASACIAPWARPWPAAGWRTVFR